MDFIESGHSAHVHLVNAYTVACAHDNPEVLSSLQGDAINFPDGRPLIWLARLKHGDKAFSQVRGPRLFLDVLEASADGPLKHFLLGGSPGTLASLVDRVKSDFRNTSLVGWDSPSYGPLDESEKIRRKQIIEDSGANVIWVGLGTPKQDLEARRLAEQLGITAIAVGAAFDFAAGGLRQAPNWIGEAGLEWVYRLIQEPRRLWKRYTVGNLKFLLAAVKNRTI